MVEVLIAGAGPAGAVAATVLARAGVRVLLVDRARFPRRKLCGDTLNPGTLAALRQLGLAGTIAAKGLPLAGMIVTGEGGVAVRGTYGAGAAGRAIMREDLDAWLLAAAAAAGAHVEEGVSAREPLLAEGPDGREVRGAVLTGRDGRRLRVPAVVTVAADGRRSALAAALGLAWCPTQPRRWAVGGYLAGVAGLADFGEMHLRRGHYFGLAPLPGGLANACAVSGPGQGWDDPAALLTATLAADPMVRDRVAGARLVGDVAVVGPLAVDARAAGAPGLLLAGDAAGFVDPMTGDGLRFAIRGGELAALVAMDMLAHGRRDGFRELSRLRALHFGPKLRFNRTVRRLSGSAAGLHLASLGARLAPVVIRKAIQVAGDVA